MRLPERDSNTDLGYGARPNTKQLHDLEAFRFSQCGQGLDDHGVYISAGIYICKDIYCALGQDLKWALVASQHGVWRNSMWRGYLKRRRACSINGGLQRSRQARNCWPIVGRSAVIGVSNPRPLARQTSSVRELGAAYLHVIDKAL